MKPIFHLSNIMARLSMELKLNISMADILRRDSLAEIATLVAESSGMAMKSHSDTEIVGLTQMQDKNLHESNNDKVQEIIARYSAELSAWHPVPLSTKAPQGDVVLLTGATGSIGKNRLANFHYS